MSDPNMSVNTATQAATDESVLVEVDGHAPMKKPLIQSSQLVAEWGSKNRSDMSSAGRKWQWCRWEPAPESSTWRVMSWLNIVVFITMLIISGISASQGIGGGRTQGDQSSRYKTSITPAAYAFSIWGLIYALNAVFVIAQALDRSIRAAATIPHLWLCVGITLWLITFSLNQIILAGVVIVVGTLFPLIVLHGTIGESSDMPGASPLAALGTRVWISIYLGWVSVATIVMLAVCGTPENGVGHGGWTASNWGLIMLSAATLLSFLVLCLHGDALYSFTTVWALVAIAHNQGDGSGYPGDDRVVAAARTYAVCLAFAASVALLWRVDWRKL